jgi:hypothetical protein
VKQGLVQTAVFVLPKRPGSLKIVSMTTEALVAKVEALEHELAAMRADLETARRRADLALGYAKEALKYSASTPRVGKMLRDIEAELNRG